MPNEDAIPSKQEEIKPQQEQPEKENPYQVSGVSSINKDENENLGRPNFQKMYDEYWVRKELKESLKKIEKPESPEKPEKPANEGPNQIDFMR